MGSKCVSYLGLNLFGVHSLRLAANSSYRQKPVFRKSYWFPCQARNDDTRSEDDTPPQAVGAFILFKIPHFARTLDSLNPFSQSHFVITSGKSMPRESTTGYCVSRLYFFVISGSCSSTYPMSFLTVTVSVPPAAAPFNPSSSV